MLVILEKSPEFAIFYYALLLCGATPCVLPPIGMSRDAKTASEKLNHIATAIRATHVISSIEAVFDVKGVEHINITEIDIEPSLNFEIKHNKVAFFQASSGTTGKPKCIAIEQKNIFANLEQIREHMNKSLEGMNNMQGMNGMFPVSSNPVLEEMQKQNMEMFERTMKMFTPFGSPASDGSSKKTEK